MTLSFMVYGFVVSVFATASAVAVDRALRSMRWPTRWVWLAALVAIGSAPFIPAFVPRDVAGVPSGGLIAPMEFLYDVSTVGAAGASAAGEVRWGVLRWVAGLWGLASGLMVVSFAGGLLRLRRERRRWHDRRVGGEPVLMSDRVGPAVIGFVHPTIVLPRWAFGLPDPALRVVMLHEREHRDARDPVLLAAGFLITALSPWNPVAWWTWRRLRFAVEADCDARTLARGVAPQAYGRLLLDVAARGQLAPALVATLTSETTLLEKRLLMIRSVIGTPRRGTFAVAATAGLALIALACETPLPHELPDSGVGPAAGWTSRIQAAVDSNWVSAEQADWIRVTLRDAAERIQPALEAGELSEAEAQKRFVAVELEVIARSVRDRADAGEIGPERARAATTAYRSLIDLSGTPVVRPRRVTESDRATTLGLEQATLELRERISAGELTPEQARRAELELGLRHAVSIGEISLEEAKARAIEEELRANGGNRH